MTQEGMRIPYSLPSVWVWQAMAFSLPAAKVWWEDCGGDEGSLPLEHLSFSTAQVFTASSTGIDAWPSIPLQEKSTL